jgi:hypothetical protein
MIIRTFHKSYLPQYLLLLALALLLWGGAFLSPPVPDTTGNPFLNPGYALLLDWLGNSPRLLVAAAFLLMLGAALLFNFTLEKSGLSATNSLVPALIFILLISLFPALQTLHRAFIPGVLVIVILHNVFDLYTEEEAYPKIFNSGFFIAVSSFFYFPSIAFILFIWFTFVVYRLYSWREWIILLFGFFTPYLLLWTWYFWTDELAMVFEAYVSYFQPKMLLHFDTGLTVINYISLGLIAILFIRGFFVQALTLQENVISVRKRFWAVMLFFVVALLSFLFSGHQAPFHAVFIQIALALIIQGLMVHLKRFLFTELVVMVLIVLIAFNNYYVALMTSIN